MSEYICVCGQKFKNPGGYSSHQKQCNEVEDESFELFECKCGDTFKGKGALESHKNYCDKIDRKSPEWSHDKVECPDCGDKVDKRQLEKHRNSKYCSRGGKYRTLLEESSNELIKQKVGDNAYECSECGEVFTKKGIGSHYYYNHTEDGLDRKCSDETLKEVAKLYNNKKYSVRDLVEIDGITKYQYYKARDKGYIQPRTIKEANKIAKEKGKIPSSHSKETREKLSKIRSEHNPGGWCDWHEYEKENGEVIKLQGKWEVKCAEILDNKNIDWIKPTNGNYFLNYKDDKGVKQKYVPDFYLPDEDMYLEVKGHWWANSKQKMDWIQSRNEDKDILVLKAENKEDFVEQTKKLL